MTFKELVELPRLGEGGLLDHWIQANENNDTKMIDLTMSAMVEQNRILGFEDREMDCGESIMGPKVDSNESDADRSRRLNLRRSLLG